MSIGFRQWWDYGEVDAFFLNPGHSYAFQDVNSPSLLLVSEDEVGSCLEVHGWLETFTELDLGIARWRRSRRAIANEERLVELRIALESIFLSDDKGVIGEKRHRLAMRGAWLLGETFEERQVQFKVLRQAYDFASSVIHAGNLKKDEEEVLARAIDEAQNLCREAILRIVRSKTIPNWSEVVLGKGFRRSSEFADL